MKEEKPLSEKRKELRNKIVDGHHIYWEEVFDVIEQQDAEAKEKLKEDILFRKEFAQNEDEDIVLRDLLIDIDKIMGNFPNAKGESVMYEPAKKIMGNFNHYSLDNKTVTKNKDTTVSNSKDKGCGEFYFDSEDHKKKGIPTKCFGRNLCPKCEVGLKEDKQ